MNELQIFNNNDFGEIRTVEIEGKIYFCGSDVAKALGYAIPHKAIREHCKGGLIQTIPTNGGEQEMKFIPEGDVYRLIVKSNLPKAEQFERWLFDEVAPSIAKHGAYMTPAKLEEVLMNPDTIIQLATALKDERAKNGHLLAENKQQEQIIGELKPKADYTDRILQSKGTVTITAIAKDYGMSGSAFNKLLHRLKIQYKQGDIWLLYSTHQAKGYTHSKSFDYNDSNGNPQTRMSTEWTQKGRLFLYQKLRNNGVLPMIEQDEASA